MCFLPRDEAARDFATAHFESFIVKEGQILIGWRDVPVDPQGLGSAVLEQMPVIRQAIVGRGASTPVRTRSGANCWHSASRRRILWQHLRKSMSCPAWPNSCMPSFSSRTLVYKGLLLAG